MSEGQTRQSVPIKVEVNGQPVAAEVESRLLLVDFLRHHLGLTGAHVGCDTTSCGACTVLFNGMGVKSCTMLAVQADGQAIQTVEGLGGADGELHPLQAAFRECHGLQCGFCTPGMLMAALDLLQHSAEPSEAEIRTALAGNICRCTGYHNIVRAIAAAAAEMRGSRGEYGTRQGDDHE